MHQRIAIVQTPFAKRLQAEMTSLYLIKQLKPLGVKVSRIGMGLPMGSAIEYADISTIGMSIHTRREVSV